MIAKQICQSAYLLHLCVLVVVMMMVVIGMKGRRGRLHKRLSVEPERTQRL